MQARWVVGGGEGRCPASVCPTQVGMTLSAHPSTPPHPDPIYLTAGSPSDQHYKTYEAFAELPQRKAESVFPLTVSP